VARSNRLDPRGGRAVQCRENVRREPSIRTMAQLDREILERAVHAIAEQAAAAVVRSRE
jgi:hypothetical protein